MAQLGQKAKASGDVATIAVSLDQEKPALAGYAQRLGKDWIVLCEYKGYESRAAKNYGVNGVPATFVLDGLGRLRLGESLSWLAQDYLDDLRLEAFWMKKRGLAPPVTAPPAAGPPPPTAAAPEVQWIFHLKSGGKIRVLSFEEIGRAHV